MSELLSIAIPTYNRSKELSYGLTKFVSQIEKNGLQQKVRIYVKDDCSTDDTSDVVAEFAENYDFIEYERYPENIGLEKNLIECGQGLSGEFLWIFGDDDFLESNDALKTIIDLLEGDTDFLILNRTRRNFQLSEIISDNWMKIDEDVYFSSLVDFVKEWGLISVIGFISVNIFRRKPFFEVDGTPYFGTMYPQLGMMLEAFGQSKVKLISEPLICHRTQTAKEKLEALGNKASEKDFMANAEKRNALYFGFPLVRFLRRLQDLKVLGIEDLKAIKELVFCDVKLLDFVLDNLLKARDFGISLTSEESSLVLEFFSHNNCTAGQLNDVKKAISYVEPFDRSKVKVKTISVITPSFNQGEFLRDCLRMVNEQTYGAIEHLVFDPGSDDGSLDIVGEFSHATLINEPDSGQSDAINKGFLAASGDVVAWINSDDYYFDDRVFERVIARFNEPDSPDIVYGRGIFLDENGDFLRNVYINKNPESLSWRFQQEDGILQPALFFKRSIVEKVGLLSENNHYSMDYEYWIRCIKNGIKFAFIDENLAIARYHKDNKTFGQRANSYREVCQMIKAQFGYANHVWLRRYAEYIVEGFDGVVSHSGVSTVTDSSLIEAKYKELLQDYNGDYDTLTLLKSKCSEKGHGDTLREMVQLGIADGNPCYPIPMDQELEDGHTCYTVAERRWAYNWPWKLGQIEKSHAFLKERMRLRNSDTCVIVGNGPSLNQTDLSLLKDVDVIISNNAFLSDELADYATYYTVVNYLVAEQSSANINRYKNAFKVLPFWLSYCLNEDDQTFFVDAMGKPEFSTDILKNMSWRHTVSFYNMHLAYGLGYKKVCLIGFDHSYNQKEGAKEEQVLVCMEDDDNHFHKDYFKGMRWQAADVGNMEAMYELAKEAFEQEGREIVNCTVGGKLELFRRGDLKVELKDVLDLSSPASPTMDIPVVGPYHPRQCAHVDENLAVRDTFLAQGISKGRMLDVGAHHGWAMKPFVDVEWIVDGFEPDPQNRAISTKRNEGLENVKIHAIAVSDQPQESVDFFTSEESTGISSLKGFRDSHEKSCEVPVTTLTHFLSDKNYEKIDYLKIDTEGFDYHVLKGFPWERYKPSVVLCEFEDSKSLPLGYRYQDLGDILQRQGYTVLISEWNPIQKYGIQHDWCRIHRFPAGLRDHEGWGNFIAFRDEEMARAYVEILRGMVECKDIDFSKEAEPVSDFKIDIKSATEVELHWELSASAEEFHVYRHYEGEWTFLCKIDGGKRTHLVELPLPGKYAFLVKTVVGDSIAEGKILWTNSWTPETKLVYDRKVHEQKLKEKQLLQKQQPQGYQSNAQEKVKVSPWKKRLGVLFPFARLSVRSLFWYKDKLKEQPLFHLCCMLAVVLTGVFGVLESHAWLWSISVLIGVGYLCIVGTAYLQHVLHQLIQNNIDSYLSKLRAEVKWNLDQFDQYQNQSYNRISSLEIALSELEGSSNLTFAQLREECKNTVAGVSEQIKSFEESEDQQLQTIERKLDQELRDRVHAFEGIEQKIVELENGINERGERVHETVQLEISETAETLRRYMDEEVSQVSKLLVGVKTSAEESHANHQQNLAVQYNCLNKAGVLNHHHFQFFNRNLTKEQIGLFQGKWSELLGLENLSSAALGYMASRICWVESTLQGRLATNVEDMMLRSLVALANKDKDQNILEIGSLFGISLLNLYDVTQWRYETSVIRGLDPLKGYYDSGLCDKFTNIPVSREVFDANVQVLCQANNPVSLIQKMSTDEGVADSVPDKSLSLLIIDGDHTYQGVEADYELYWKKVKPGGYILFDDYGSPEWPDVQVYADSVVAGNTQLKFVGFQWRTAVFQVIK